MKVKIDNEDINVNFQKKKIKKTYIKITNKKEILITSPYKLKEEDIIGLINDNYDWINKQVKKINVIKIEDNEFLLFGKIYKIDNTGDKSININHEKLQSKSSQKLIDYATQTIQDVFEELVLKYNFNFTPELKFRKMHSRWGVCHYKTGIVVLNKILFHVPIKLVEYVIYHELTHFKHPNHSKAFYEELGRFCVNHRQLKAQLTEYGSLL